MEWLMVGVMRLCKTVGIINVVGQMYEGRFRRLCTRDRWGVETGVTMSLGMLAFEIVLGRAGHTWFGRGQVERGQVLC